MPIDRATTVLVTASSMLDNLARCLTTLLMPLVTPRNSSAHSNTTRKRHNTVRISSTEDPMSLTTEPCTRASGPRMASDKAKASKFGEMDPSTRDTGATIWPTTREG